MKTPGRISETMVYVIDDDPLVRTMLEALFRSVGLQVRAFAAGTEFLRLDRPAVPACLVLDVRLPGLGGLELQRELALCCQPIPIVFITGHGDIPMSVRAMKAGAVEFLTKPFREQDLLDAVQHAVERDRVALKTRMESAELRSRCNQLTPREREVAGLVVSGMLNKQIAARLGTTEITVKIQRASAMKKLRASSLPDLVRIADKAGLTTRVSTIGFPDRGKEGCK